MQNIDAEESELDEFQYQTKTLNHTNNTDLKKPPLFYTSTRKRKLSDKIDKEIMNNINEYIGKKNSWQAPSISPSNKFSSNNDISIPDTENSYISDKSMSPIQKIPKLMSKMDYENRRFLIPFKNKKVAKKFPLSDEAHQWNKSKTESFASFSTEGSPNNSSENYVKHKDKFIGVMNFSSVADYYSYLVKRANSKSPKKPFFLKEKTDMADNFHSIKNFKSHNFQDKKNYCDLCNERIICNNKNFGENSNSFQNLDNTFINNQRKHFYANSETLPINNFNFGKNYLTYPNEFNDQLYNLNFKSAPNFFQNYYQNPHLIGVSNPPYLYNEPVGYFFNDTDQLKHRDQFVNRDESLSRRHFLSPRLHAAKSFDKHWETKSNFNFNPNKTCIEFQNMKINDENADRNINDLSCIADFKYVNPYYYNSTSCE